MKYEKGTFSITPNKEILRGKPTELQAIYFWLCERADQNGICFPSRPKIARDAGIKSVRTVDKYISMLVDIGLLAKTKRGKSKDLKYNSNLYQIMVQEMHDDGANNDTTIGAPNDTLTIPIINNTHLTISTDTTVSAQPEVEEVSQLGKLPDKFGKTYILRLHYIYRYLWKKRYGTRLSSQSMGQFGKAMKTLLENNTEQQIAVLLLTFFNWHGGSGDNPKENKYLSDNGFPPYLMINKIDIFIAYLTNNIGLCYTDPNDIERYVIKNFKEIL